MRLDKSLPVHVVITTKQGEPMPGGNFGNKYSNFNELRYDVMVHIKRLGRTGVHEITVTQSNGYERKDRVSVGVRRRRII